MRTLLARSETAEDEQALPPERRALERRRELRLQLRRWRKKDSFRKGRQFAGAGLSTEADMVALAEAGTEASTETDTGASAGASAGALAEASDGALAGASAGVLAGALHRVGGFAAWAGALHRVGSSVASLDAPSGTGAGTPHPPAS